MTTLAEQVSGMEADNATLLATVESLKATLEAQKAEILRLTHQNEQLIQFTAGTRGLIETTAKDVLEALRSTRREAYDGEKPAETAPRGQTKQEAHAHRIYEVDPSTDLSSMSRDDLPIFLTKDRNLPPVNIR